MSTYPPNNTTPKSPSGSYLWNWLGSPLKKFAAALAPYLGDGYSYKEINYSSAELIAGTSGYADLLPDLPSGQFYEWKMNVLFIPGVTPYDPPSPDNISIAGNYTFYGNIQVSDISNNQNMVWQVSSFSYVNGQNNSGEPCGPSDFNYLKIIIPVGAFVSGDGTMKVKIWYKVVNFG